MGYRILWWTLAASLFILGASTWDTTGTISAQLIVRQFSLPILAIELAVVVGAYIDGFEPSVSIRAMPLWARLALGVVTLIAIGTALFVAPHREVAVLRTCGLVIHFLFGLSLQHLFQTRWKPLRAIIWPSLVVGILAYAVLLGVFVASIPDPIGYDWVHLRLGVMHVRHLGYYAAIGSCTALGLAITASNRLTYLVWLSATALTLAISFWSGTRGTLFALPAAYAIGTLAFPSLRKIKAVGTLAAALIIGLLVSLVQQPPSPYYGAFRIFLSSSTGDPSSGRVEFWIATFRKFLERPLFGFGESQFQFVIPEAAGMFKHPHNFPLQLLLQWGVIGTVCVLGLGGLLLQRFNQAARQIGVPSIPAYLLAAGVLAYSLIDGTLYYPYPIAMFAISMAWVLAVRVSHQPHQSGVSATSGVF